MNLFDGQFKSRPKINLAGFSSTKSRDLLIQEAIAERHRREAEKRQHISATKIQSTYRSYKARTTLQSGYRDQFKKLLAQPSHTLLELKTLLSYFVSFYSSKSNQTDLNQFSQFVVKSKERFVAMLMSMAGSNAEYALCRFSGLHLRLLNAKTLDQAGAISHSVSLRLIDYFTDPKSYAGAGYSTEQYETVLARILKFLINQGKSFFLYVLSLELVNSWSSA